MNYSSLFLLERTSVAPVKATNPKIVEITLPAHPRLAFTTKSSDFDKISLSLGLTAPQSTQVW